MPAATRLGCVSLHHSVRAKISVGRPQWLPSVPHTQVRSHSSPPPYRPSTILDDYVRLEARPISLKQLTFFGRTLTKDRLLSSANYVRNELPVRLAHRLRDMQTLPYIILSNPHMSGVYELYYTAFETFRKVGVVDSVEKNDEFCRIVNEMLDEHLTVIPSLATGVLECKGFMEANQMDRFMNTILRARISRRVIAEQHLALTETWRTEERRKEDVRKGIASEQHAGGAAKTRGEPETNEDFVGEVFLKCNAAEVVEACGQFIRGLALQAFGPEVPAPKIRLEGHLDATFPYILSHLEYIIGELLRNSVQASIQRWKDQNPTTVRDTVDKRDISPIDVLIAESPQHVIFRISDRAGGVPADLLPYIWSFSKGPRASIRLGNLSQVPMMAGTLQELHPAGTNAGIPSSDVGVRSTTRPGNRDGSLASLAKRPPELKLGMGLPMSRVYAEYWAGSLELQSLEGYGTDVFLQISKLGNKNEQLTRRASMDAV